MTSAFEDFQDKFQVAELTVLRTEHWTWSVRPGQCTIGAGILSLNRFARSFAEITAVEGSELALIVAATEPALRAFCAPDKVNYLMLMMVDAHVHFHVVPRFATPRILLGREWDDPGWPALPDLSARAGDVPAETIHDVRDHLRALVGQR